MMQNSEQLNLLVVADFVKSITISTISAKTMLVIASTDKAIHSDLFLEQL